MGAFLFRSECDDIIDNTIDDEKKGPGQTDLHVAAKNNDLENVKNLLNLGVDVNQKTDPKLLRVKKPCWCCGMLLNEIKEEIECYCSYRNIKYCYHKGDEFGNEMKDGDDVAQTALHFAAKHGDAELVELLLPFVDNVNEPSEDDSTALHYATQNRDDDTDVRVAQLLLDHGADLEARNKDGKTPLYLAVKLEKLNLVKFLLSVGADPNALTSKSSTPLYSAIMNDNAELISLLLKHGATVSDICNHHGEKPLFYALRVHPRGDSRIRMVSLLLGAGVPPNERNEQGSTTLHVAVQENDVHLAHLLLKRGCPPTEMDQFALCPLALAVCMNRLKIARLLLDYGAPADDFVSRSTVLEHAVIRRNEQMVRLLLRYGADPDFGRHRNKPVFAACLHKNTRFMDILVAAGADINCKDKSGQTPLMTVVGEPNYPMMRFLLRHGANLNDSDNWGNTAFHILFKNNTYNKEDVIEYFFNTGADPNLENWNGQTPFHCMLRTCFTGNEVLVFLKNIALLVAFGKYVNPKITNIEKRDNPNSWFQKFHAYCQELEKMKMTKFLGEYSYFQVISLNYKQLIPLFQEENVVQAFEMGVREHCFTDCIQLLSKHFYSKHERYELVKCANCSLSTILRSHLPLEIIEHVVEYLSNEDIKKLL